MDTAMYPQPALTPGHVLIRTSEQICIKGYATKARRVSFRTRVRVYLRYGILSPRGYRLDHLVPLELGGANSIQNLWPMPKDFAAMKDHVENGLHHDVCHGIMTLADAQAAIIRDWFALYPQYQLS